MSKFASDSYYRWDEDAYQADNTTGWVLETPASIACRLTPVRFMLDGFYKYGGIEYCGDSISKQSWYWKRFRIRIRGSLMNGLELYGKF